MRSSISGILSVPDPASTARDAPAHPFLREVLAKAPEGRAEYPPNLWKTLSKTLIVQANPLWIPSA
jgi:hypothetical protein